MIFTLFPMLRPYFFTKLSSQPSIQDINYIQNADTLQPQKILLSIPLISDTEKTMVV